MTSLELVCPTIFSPFFVHWILGLGLPRASHLRTTLLPAPAISFSGAWMKDGGMWFGAGVGRFEVRWTTWERARPKVLVASQW